MVARAPAKPATLSGRVVRASDGVPIGGAVIALAHGAHALDAGEPPVVVASGSDGRWSARDVVPGTSVLTVTAPGFVPHARDLVVADGEARSDVDVALDAGGVLVTGTIATEQHQPIANARVRAYRDGHGPRFVAHSGADGRYQLGLAPGSYQLEVTHDDHRRTWRNVTAGDEPVTADVVLVRGGLIRGVVVARDTGQPVAHADVDGVGGGDASSARAGGDGAFTLRGLHDGLITIHARGRGYASATPTTVELDPGAEASDLRVLVDPAGTIVGRVVAGDDHARGIGGAAVRAMGDASWPASDVSDPDGYFELVGMRPGSYWLSADKRGMLFEDGVEVEVVGTEVADALVEMRSGAAISGRVDPPVAAEVALSIAGGDLLGAVGTDGVSIERARTETDASGAFTLRAVPDGDFEITAMTKDGRTGAVPVAIAGSSRSGLVIRLSPRASVSGRVVDDRGRPVAGAYVHGQRLDAPFATRFRRDGIHRGVTSTSAGAFTIVGLDAGTWKLSVEGGSIEVELAEGAALTGVTITARARDHEIRGTVLGPDRKPVGGARVHALHEVAGASASRFDLESAPVRTDADGSFLIDRLWSGTYTLVAEGPRAATKTAVGNVRAGQSITIVLEPAGTLTITLTRAGAPAAANVHCRGPGPDNELHAEMDAGGSHTFTSVAQGEYRCDAYSADGSASGSMVVRGEAPATLALALEEHATLTGIAVAALTGQPVANMSVAARATLAETDASGRFVLERVPAGTGELHLRPAHQVYPGVDRHPYTAKPGERVDLGRIVVVPPRTGAVGTFGLSLDIRDDTLVVAKVKPDSPADRASIEPGSPITAIDGHAVTDLGLDRAKRLLTSEAVATGQAVTLLLGSGARVTVTAVTW